MGQPSKVAQRVYCSLSGSTMYQLIGGELSPYTAKVRLYMRYKNIPFEPVQATAEMYANFIKPKVGWSVIPVLVTSQNKVIQDSSEILSKLETWHPQPPVIPSTPKQGMVSALVELFCDEWMVLPIMHYRWSFPENKSFLKEEFGRIAFPKEGHKERSNIAEVAYSKFAKMLPILGITEKTKPEIERSWEALLDDLTTHFDKHPYLLGGRPSVGDFSMAGMTYAHLFRDPCPGYIMKTKAPLVAAWVENMNGHLPHANRLHLHHVDTSGRIVRDDLPAEDTQFCPNDEIPPTLLPILHRFFEEYAPVLLSAKTHMTKYIKENVSPKNSKLPRSIGTHQFTIGGVTESRGIFPIQIWKWQRVTDLYRHLAADEKKTVDQFAAQFPCGQELIQADLSPCRVERIENILHAANSSSTAKL